MSISNNIGHITTKLDVFMKKTVGKNKLAFTLSEVLITLGIIGVVAAVTIPTVLQKTQEQQTISALKKAYSTLSNAYTQSVKDNGTPDEWALVDDQDGSKPMIDKLAPYLKVTKTCDGYTPNDDCFPSDPYKTLNNSDLYPLNSNYPGAKLADGTLIAGIVSDPDCPTWPVGNNTLLQNVCGHYFVDINGFKKPNQFGKDTFGFLLTKNGIIPMGTQQENGGGFSGGCEAAGADGLNCTAWVIYNQNMDYLHCSGLNWDTKTKCN